MKVLVFYLKKAVIQRKQVLLKKKSLYFSVFFTSGVFTLGYFITVTVVPFSNDLSFLALMIFYFLFFIFFFLHDSFVHFDLTAVFLGHVEMRVV